MQRTAKKNGLTVIFFWYRLYHFSLIATLPRMPCSKRPRGDVHCLRSAATPPDANFGLRGLTVSTAATDEAVVRVGLAFAGVWHA